MAVPVATEPVNTIWSMPEWDASAAPAVEPTPHRICTAAGGNPACSAAAAKQIEDSGSSSGDLIMQALPVANAGAIERAAISTG